MPTNDEVYLAAREKRKLADIWWKVGLFFTILCLIEIPLPPMTPLIGFIGASIAGGFTAHFLFLAKRLPIREALLLAKARDGQLTLTNLCIDLELHPTAAKVLLQKMQTLGLLQVDESVLYKDGDLRYRLKS